MFLSKKCRLSFGGYAIQQIRKARGLDKKMNWEKQRIERKDILDFCYVHKKGGSVPVKDKLKEIGVTQEQVGLVSIPHMRNCYAMYDALDREGIIASGIASDLLKSNDVSLTSIPSNVQDDHVPNVMYFNKEAYSTHCREYREYQEWLKNRNTQRYVDIESHGQQIDGKNMLHCVRLIETALEIPKDVEINVRRPNAKYLIEIRKGQHDLESILDKCENDLKTLDEAFENANLPDAVDDRELRDLAILVREEFQKTENV
jgi:hypothetical protein